MARRFGFLSRYLNSIASAVVGGGFVVNLGTTLTVNDAHGQLREQLKKQFTKGDKEGQWDNGGQVFELGQPNVLWECGKTPTFIQTAQIQRGVSDHEVIIILKTTDEGTAPRARLSSSVANLLSLRSITSNGEYHCCDTADKPGDTGTGLYICDQVNRVLVDAAVSHGIPPFELVAHEYGLCVAA